MNRNIFLGIIIYGMYAVNSFAFAEDNSSGEYCHKDDVPGSITVVRVGAGSGTTRAIICEFPASGATVTLVAIPDDASSTFVGWDPSESDSDCAKENFEMPTGDLTCTAQFDKVIVEVPAPISSTELTSPGTASTTDDTISPAGTTVTTTTTSGATSSSGSAVTSGMTNTPTGPAATTTIPPSGTTSNNPAVASDMAGTTTTGSVATTTTTPSGSTTSSGPTVTSGTAGTTQGTTATGNTQPTSVETVKGTSTPTASTTGGPDSGTNASSAVSAVDSGDSGKGSTSATTNSTPTPTNGPTATGSSNGAMVPNTSSTTTTSVTETPSTNPAKPESTTSGSTTTTVSPTTSTPATVEGSTNHSPNAPVAGSNVGNTSVTTTSPPNTGGSNENDNQPSGTATTTTTGEYVTPGSSTVSNNQPSGNNEVDSTSPQGGTAETAYGNGDFISGQPFYPGATVDPAYYEGMNSEYVAGSGQSPAYYETQPVSYNNASSTWSSPYANDYADHWAKANPNRSTTLDLGIDPKQWTLTLYPSRNSQLVDNKDGTLTYTANSNFKGVDTFSYSMADSSGQTSVYIVKIQVSADYAGYDYWDFTKDTSGSDYSGNHGNTIYNAWPPATACDLIYAVNDQGVSDSQLLYIDPNQKTTQAFGPILNGYDIEGLEISPYNNRLYAVSSASAPKDRRGQLYVVDPNNAELTVIGKTGFDDINALAFRYDGTLWGWAAGKGIVQIDPETARSYVRVPFKRINAEGLAWTSDGRYLYASEGSDLWWWHYGDASEVSKKCQNLPGEVEALETLGSGMLMFAIDQDDGHKIYVYDPWDCKIVMDRSFISNYSDIESFAWSTKCEPQPAQLPALENWTGEFKDSAKLNDSECRTKPGWITVEGKVSLTPATSQAFIRSNWQVVNLSSDESAPEVGDGQPACPNAPAPFNIDCVSPHYNSEIISDNFNFKVMAWWPGKPSKANVDMDTILGTYVSIDILDLKGNSIAGTSKLSRTLWWIESLCDGSNDKPAKTPKVTKIEVVEPEDVNIDSREDKDSPFTNEPLESSKGGAGAAETEVAAEVVGEESKDSKEPTAKDENTDQAAKDNTKPAKVNSDKSSTTAKDKAAKDKVAKDKAAKDKAAKDKAAKDKAAKETKKDQPAAQVKEDKADQATVSDKSPEDKEDKVNSDKADNSAKGDSSNKEDNSAKADNQVDDYAKSEKDSAKDAKTDNAAKADQADKVDKTDKADNTDKVEKTDKTDKADSDSAKSNEKASSTDESTDKITEVDKAKEDKSTEEDKSAKEDKSTGEDKSTKEDKSATDKSKSDSADKRDEGKN